MLPGWPVTVTIRHVRKQYWAVLVSTSCSKVYDDLGTDDEGVSILTQRVPGQGRRAGMSEGDREEICHG